MRPIRKHNTQDGSRALRFLLLITTLAMCGALLIEPAYPLAISGVRASGYLTRRPVLTLGQARISFEPNQGQTTNAVRYIAHTAGAALYFKPSKVEIEFMQPIHTPANNKFAFAHTQPSSAHKRSTTQQYKMELALIGARRANISASDQLAGTVSYFVGADRTRWRTGIRTYSKLKYENVYEGIDQIFYGTGAQLEYDFDVAPGANPGVIRMRFSGHDSAVIDAAGALQIFAKNVSLLTIKKPTAYQVKNGARVAVPAEFKLKGGELSFKIGEYDRSTRLTIDPVVSYSSYFGGSGNDVGFDIATDNTGASFVTGATDSSSFSGLGGTNAFIAKFSLDGTERLFLAILGGAGDDTGLSIGVDPASNAYIAGSTESHDFPITNAIQSNFAGGTQDAFIAKLDPTGANLLYSTYLGGSGNDNAFGLAVDGLGSAYVTGSTDSPELSSLGNTDVFVTKLNPQGSAQSYFSILGGSGDDSAFDIAVDPQGRAYIGGSTDSSNFTTTKPLQANLGGTQDAFVAKLSPLGVPEYSTYFGGSGTDSCFGVATDVAGNAYITGATDSAELTGLGGRDVFVAKFSATGSERNFLTILGGAGDDTGFSLAVAPNGNVHVIGATDSSNFTTENATQPSLGGAQDAFVCELDSAGASLVYSTFLGGSANDAGFGIALDSAGATFVTGFTSSTDFPTGNALQTTCGGNGDAFIAKFSESAAPTSVIQFSVASATINENVSHLDLTVTRTGDTAIQTSVNYATTDESGTNPCSFNSGLASSKCDYLTTIGTLIFAPGEVSKGISIPIVEDAFAEGPETFTIALSSPAGSVLGPTKAVTITISDDDHVTGQNPSDDAAFFVRQHYIDFLNREPDAAGLNFWTNEITSCGTNAECIEVKRINVSAAFYLSIEFQETGYLVYRMYKASFGNLAGGPVPVRFVDFLRDTQEIGQGVQVGIGAWEVQLAANKEAFASAFVERPEFLAAYPNNLSSDEIIAKLDSNAGLVLTNTERQNLLELLGATPADKSKRAAVLRSIAENSLLKTREFNKAFVLMQYFGYLRRDPNDAPDSDFGGYNFWLNKLNDFGGNFINAEMVKAFISSIEYRKRFGP